MLLNLPLWFQASLWGFVSGSALVIGAAFRFLAKELKRLIAFVMAFGNGILISVLAFDLMEQACKGGRFSATYIGFISGASIYSTANHLINKKAAKHRKRSFFRDPISMKF